MGNAVVLKPASDTPVTGGTLLAKIFEEAGLPPGVLSVVVGSGSEIGDAIVEHPAARVVSFTGSTQVGEGITRKAGIKKLALELGGNGPLVVLEDADIDQAVDAAVFGSFFHQGQICMIANRIILDATIHDTFVEKLVTHVQGLTLGDPSDPDTDLGPVINQSQLDDIQDKVRRAIEDGAEQLTGGDPTGLPAWRCRPTSCSAPTTSPLRAKKCSDPSSPSSDADDEEHALRIANDTEYGLSSAVFTGDAERGVRFAQRVDAGMTHINDSPVNDDSNTAFGGEKASGIGRFGGQWAVDEFTTEHWISVQREPRQFPI